MGPFGRERASCGNRAPGTPPPATTGDGVFAERHFSGIRQRHSLPSATLGKIKHSSKRYFAECPTVGKQKHSAKCVLPSVQHSANNNTRQSSTTDGRQQPAVWFAECPPSGTRQNILIFFPFCPQTFCVVILYYLELHMQFWLITWSVCYI
jgi:hypothetical protein